jgi:hypothetical protein
VATTGARHSFRIPSAVETASAIYLSILIYIAARATHVVIHFHLLGLGSVIGATIVFASMALIWLCYSVATAKFKFRFPRTTAAWATIILLTLFIWVVTSPLDNQFFTTYAPDFPITTIDSGGFVAPDTFHHASLIYSIMQFGYSSTGLDGTPFTAYHVLSHYVDAVVLKVTQLAPLESVGLFLQLKIMLFASSVLTLIWFLFRSKPPWVQLAMPTLLLPVIAGSWRVVGSHGLWFTSFLLVVSTPFVVNIVFTERRPKTSALALVGLLGVALCLGKISTGFMFILIVGLMLWLGNKGDWRIYGLGVIWVAFLLFYGQLIAQDRPDATATSHSLAERLLGVTRYVFIRDLSGPVVMGIYAAVSGFILFAIYSRSKRLWEFVCVSGLSFGFLMLLAGLKFEKSDLYYFTQGFFFLCFLFLIAVCSRSNPAFRLSSNWLEQRGPRRQTIPIIAVLVSVGLFGQTTEFSLISPNLTVVQKSFTRAFQFEAPRQTSRGALSAFRESLEIFMHRNGLNSSNAQLFIPREVWENNVSLLNRNAGAEKTWALPLMVYATTGVPLFKGVLEMHESYGFSAYGKESITPTRAEFEHTLACGRLAIIEVRSFSPAGFNLRCAAT